MTITRATLEEESGQTKPYTVDAKDVMNRAQVHAYAQEMRLNSLHILLALCLEKSASAYQAFELLGVCPIKVRKVSQSYLNGQSKSRHLKRVYRFTRAVFLQNSLRVAWTTDAWLVLEFALEKALTNGRHITSLDLLEGLYTEKRTLAHSLLQKVAPQEDWSDTYTQIQRSRL